MKWLLAITLFISLWTLPGYPRKSAFHETPKFQKEVILSERKTSKSAVSFQKIYSFICLKSIRADLYKSSFGMVIRLHNTLVKNTLQHVAERLYSVESFDWFIQLKTIPQSSDEDFSNSFLRG